MNDEHTSDPDASDRASRHAVACFLRAGTDVLLLRRRGADGSPPGPWGVVEADAGDDLEASAREAVAATTGLLDACTLVRVGDPLRRSDATDARDGDGRVVSPVLFDCDAHDSTADERADAHEWAPPTALLDRETVPRLWDAYRRVAPGPASVREDREHGSAYLSVRACEALRDRAAELAAGREAVDDGDGPARGATPSADSDPPPDERATLAALARELRDARPSMVVVANRVNRVMSAAGEEPDAVADRASEVVADALRADEGAAEHAASELDGAETVLTLSRSGTVRTALAALDPDRVAVAESRPGAEGVGVAEALAADRAVTLLPDSAVAHALASGDVDAVLVGADTVLPDGRVVNKVGTRAALTLADREGVPAVVVAARDKVSPRAETHLEPLDPAAVYDGDAAVDVLAPTFDVTPAGVATLVTEEGPCGPGAVTGIARSARRRARWDDGFVGGTDGG